MNHQFCEYKEKARKCRNEPVKRIGDRLYCEQHGNVVAYLRQLAQGGFFPNGSILGSVRR
jgi:hypothetical protein